MFVRHGVPLSAIMGQLRDVSESTVIEVYWVLSSLLIGYLRRSSGKMPVDLKPAIMFFFYPVSPYLAYQV